jgi:hypothetical protein
MFLGVFAIRWKQASSGKATFLHLAYGSRGAGCCNSALAVVRLTDRWLLLIEGRHAGIALAAGKDNSNPESASSPY